jgi:hypothetical protein
MPETCPSCPHPKHRELSCFEILREGVNRVPCHCADDSGRTGRKKRTKEEDWLLLDAAQRLITNLRTALTEADPDVAAEALRRVRPALADAIRANEPRPKRRKSHA